MQRPGIAVSYSPDRETYAPQKRTPLKHATAGLNQSRNVALVSKLRAMRAQTFVGIDSNKSVSMLRWCFKTIVVASLADVKCVFLFLFFGVFHSDKLKEYEGLRGPTAVVHIEGNIGAGKSSVMQELLARGHFVEQESVDVDNSLFRRALVGESVFELQVAAHVDMVQRRARLNDSGLSGGRTGGVHALFRAMERGPMGSAAFVRAAAAARTMTPLQLALCSELITTYTSANNGRADTVLYLDVAPRLCLDRVRRRDRHGEEDISLEYLETVDACYRKEMSVGHRDMVVVTVEVREEWSVQHTTDKVVEVLGGRGCP